MTKADLKNFQQQLLDLRTRLNGDVSHLTDEALHQTGQEVGGNLSSVPIHMADLGTDAFEQENTLNLLQNEEQVLAHIAAPWNASIRALLDAVRNAARKSPRPVSALCLTLAIASSAPKTGKRI